MINRNRLYLTWFERYCKIKISRQYIRVAASFLVPAFHLLVSNLSYQKTDTSFYHHPHLTTHRIAYHIIRLTHAGSGDEL